MNSQTKTPLEQARENCQRIARRGEPRRTEPQGQQDRGERRLTRIVCSDYTQEEALTFLFNMPGVIAAEIIASDATRPDTHRVRSYRAQATGVDHEAHFGKGFTLLAAVNDCKANYMAAHEKALRREVLAVDDVRREIYRDDGDATSGTLEVDQSARTRAATEAKFGGGR